MLKIERKEIKKYPYYSCDVYIDGELIDEIKATIQANETKYQLSINSKDMTKKIFSYPINYFLPQANRLQFYGGLTWFDEKYFESEVRIDISEDEFTESTVSIDIFPQVSNWDLGFSINDYISSFFNVWEIIKNNRQLPFDCIDWALDKYAEDYQISLSNTFDMYLEGETIKEVLSPLIDLVKECHESALNLLGTEKAQNTFIGKFEFPSEIKVSCEQYLLYFVQFLRDLGVNATSNLKEDAGKVLFSVTPIDDIKALNKIREALAIYLNLPSSPIAFNEGFEAMRLQQQIRNLHHSQQMTEMEVRSTQYALRLAQQNIENQDKIIQRQISLLHQQDKFIEKIISKSIMIDSLENKEELEEFCDGLKFGESKFLKEQLGIHFNPAKFIKTFGKKLIGKDHEIISILDSEEETEKNS